jgi:rhodanese-related sulfurtransferase
MSRVCRQDLAWAAYILGLALLIGLLQQWPLVRQAWQGELAPRLEQARSQRRQQQFQGVQTINLAQAYAIFQQGKALFIDARPPDEYAEIHISQALNITPNMLDNGGAGQMAAFPKNREIVVYCSQESCDLALKVAEKLQALGFSRVMAFAGGFRAWDEAGYPADTSK